MKKIKVMSILIFFFSVPLQAKMYVEAGSTLPIFGNKSKLRPIVSTGYQWLYSKFLAGANYSQWFGERHSAIVAINAGYNDENFFFLPLGYGYLFHTTRNLGIHWQYYLTCGYKFHKGYYIAFKHISSGHGKKDILTPNGHHNLGENSVIIGFHFNT